jgi:hypothetical protein
MKKYVSPELNVELFNLIDLIMVSGPDFGGKTNGTDNPNGPDEGGGDLPIEP